VVQGPTLSPAFAEAASRRQASREKEKRCFFFRFFFSGHFTFGERSKVKGVD
jgi:hypothetical protein